MSSPRSASLNIRRAYADVIGRLAAELGPLCETACHNPDGDYSTAASYKVGRQYDGTDTPTTRAPLTIDRPAERG